MLNANGWRLVTGVRFLLLSLVVLLASSCVSWFSSGPDLEDGQQPVITGNINPDIPAPQAGQTVTLSVNANDPQGQALSYTWDDGDAANGTFTGNGADVTWMTDVPGTYTITVVVRDSDGNETTKTMVITVAAEGALTTPSQAGYAGKDACLNCHGSQIDGAVFDTHRHNHKLNPATGDFIGPWWTGSHDFDGINMVFNADYSVDIAGVNYPLARALGWGFEKWKQRYIVPIGNSWYITPAQHNMITDEWVNYHVSDWDAATGAPTGPSKSYDRRCAGCHTTGTNVGFFESTGEWVMGVSEENVQCEACHGPGADHVAAPSSANIINPDGLMDFDRQIESCGACHGRGSSIAELGGSTMGYPFSPDGKDYIPGEVLANYYTQKPGLWPDGHSKQHHQQYNDYLLSEHYASGSLTCWTCHNTHEPDAPFTNDNCTSCHADKAGSQLDTHTQHSIALQCIDCHMPFTAKSAVAYDVRSHAFDIISPQTSLDNYNADPTLVMPNSCMNGGCHGGPDALDDPAAIQDKLDHYNTMFGGGGGGISTPAQEGYAGKSRCITCHSSDIDIADFDNHRHNHKLNPATGDFIGPWWTGSHDFDGINMVFNADYSVDIAGVNYPLARALGWGFEKWKQRYIVPIGNSWYITPAQHNMITDEWVNYHVSDWDAATGAPTGPSKSYDRRCAGCHTTGTNVGFFESTGEWVMGVSEENVQCEACHGPGETHADGPSAANIVNPASDISDFDRKIEVCGACHGRGSSVAELGGSNMGYPFSAAGDDYAPGEVLADYYTQSPGLWPDGHSKQHHQQYNDYLLSEHYASGSLTCWTCHNVHEPDAPFTNDNCLGCHTSDVPDLNEHTGHTSALQCIDCHMPFTAKSAIAYDVRSHAFDIISPQTSLDNYNADPTLVMPNSCMNGGCHGGPDALDDPVAIQDKLDDYHAMFGGIVTAPQAGYVGKNTCLGCHSGDVDGAIFDTHRHNHKLNPATSDFIGPWWTGTNDFDGINMDFSVDSGVYSANIAGADHEIVRALGWGVNKWKQRYIVNVGSSWYITPAQHNVVTDEWVNYHVSDWDGATGMPAGPSKSYDRRCAGCHTTGTNVGFYDATGEWVMGVSEENVQCEACHGPGEVHAGSMSAADIINPSDLADYDRKIEACGACHGRGSSVAELGGSNMGYPFSAAGDDYMPGEVLADYYTQSPGLWPDGHSKQHHQQYNDFLMSGHYASGFVTCWSCHNVHEPDAPYTNDNCLGCHSGDVPDLNAHTNHTTALQCIDCHMPFTAKSAIAYDVRSHAFDIISPQTSLDNFVADPTNVMPNSCMNGGCHPELSLDNQADIEAKLADFETWWP